MTVVTFTDYTPVARYDDLPWTQARIEGSDSQDGPWSTIETIALDPVDSDPSEPATRDFTTEEATDETWFRIVFVDADGDESVTEAIRQALIPAGLRPTLRDVAAVIGAYTRSDASGGPAGTFDDTTNPTADQVEDFITHATTELALKLPDELGDEVQPFARRLAAIRAAMFVIVSLQSDEDTSEDSAYNRLKEMFDSGWAALQAEIPGKTGAGVSVGSVALKSPFTGAVAVMDPADPDA